jgi:hypothetical protein
VHCGSSRRARPRQRLDQPPARLDQPLIACGIGETVAQHPFTAPVPVGSGYQVHGALRTSAAFRRPYRPAPLQQQFTQPLRQRCAAGFAQQYQTPAAL